MSIITLEFDNKLKKSEIIVPLVSSSKFEGGDEYHDTGLIDKAQTSVMGIQMPLIMINKTVIDFDAVYYFELKSKGVLPELFITVEDRYEIINNIDKPSNDNEVRIQVIPRFDNAYKKIDLTFYITSITVTGSLIQLSCAYKLPMLMSSQYKSFGKIDTYTLFKNIAIETKLGFATNIGKLSDNRIAYCDNKSLLDLMNSEINFANATEHIMDWWVDLWDNINLVDIKERYNTVDNKEDMQIWVAGQIHEVSLDIETLPQQVTATVNNLPMLSNSELYVKSYTIVNNTGINIANGTDKVCGVYDMSKKEYFDTLIQDGDIKNDIYLKYEYLGEVYGEYNYMLSNVLRNAFIQKINSETITITLNSPLLGLMRGHKVNYIRYVNNSIVENKLKNMEQNNMIDRNVNSNISLSEYESDIETDNGKFIIDKTVSGQYLITGVDIIYSNNTWDYVLTLVKPASSKVTLLNN